MGSRYLGWDTPETKKEAGPAEPGLFAPTR
jgi:hypothetical protein